jgi:hypothetical protein
MNFFCCRFYIGIKGHLNIFAPNECSWPLKKQIVTDALTVRKRNTRERHENELFFRHDILDGDPFFNRGFSYIQK